MIISGIIALPRVYKHSIIGTLSTCSEDFKCTILVSFFSKKVWWIVWQQHFCQYYKLCQDDFEIDRKFHSVRLCTDRVHKLSFSFRYFRISCHKSFKPIFTSNSSKFIKVMVLSVIRLTKLIDQALKYPLCLHRQSNFSKPFNCTNNTWEHYTSQQLYVLSIPLLIVWIRI